MKFILNLAYREIRSSWYRLLFFFICIAIGVGSIVTLRSIVQNLKVSVMAESRSLLTADVSVSSSKMLCSGDNRKMMEKFIKSPLVENHTCILTTPTMLRPSGLANATPRLVDLKAVGNAFPFYGDVILSDGVRYSHNILKNQGALVKSNLLTMMNLKVGDKVKIGSLEFTIRGVIIREPGSSMNAFAFGPRVLIDYDDAVRAGLTGLGSRARYAMLFKTSPWNMPILFNRLTSEFSSQPLMSVRSYKYSEDRMSESLNKVEDYLSLIGLVILILGGIGISSVTRVFIQQKLKTIAVLKCLGSRNSNVFSVYLTQVMMLGLIGSTLGLVFSYIASLLLPMYFGNDLPIDLRFTLTGRAIMQGIGIGMLVSLLFSLLPLMEIRFIKPILILRNTVGAEKRRIDLKTVIAGIIVFGGLIGLSAWQAGSFKIGLILLGGLGVMMLILMLGSKLLMWLLRKARNKGSFTLRQGISTLYRPGNQTTVTLTAIGLGVFFIVSVRLLQANLENEFNFDLNSARSDLFMIDIQADQRSEVQSIINKYGDKEPQLVPTVRARISHINNIPINSETDKKRNRGMLAREYQLSYRPALDPQEKLLSGKFWDAAPSSTPEISIEKAMRDELGLDVGDTVTFDILGKSITAPITSVRKVDIRNSRSIFFLVLFRPGVLENAPTVYIGAAKGPPKFRDRAHMIREIVNKYPNVSIIDLYDVMGTARDIIDKVTTAITFVGGFVLMSGLLILIGSIAMTKFSRLYESAVFKTLGAKKKLIATFIIIEYGILGLLAGLLGSSAAIALSWAVSEYIFKITWTFMPTINIIAIILAIAVVIVVGIISSVDVMVKKPLSILRSSS